jgi:hypothetical protein
MFYIKQIKLLVGTKSSLKNIINYIGGDFWQGIMGFESGVANITSQLELE